MFYHSQPDCLVPLTFPTPSQSGASGLSLIDPHSLVSCPHPAMHGSLTSIILLTDGILILSACKGYVGDTYVYQLHYTAVYFPHSLYTLSLHTFIKVMYSPFMILQFYFFHSLLPGHCMNNTHASCYYGTHCPKGVQSDCMGIAKQQLDISASMSD